MTAMNPTPNDDSTLGAVAVACVRGGDSVAELLPITTRVYIDTLRSINMPVAEMARHALKHHQRVGAALKAAQVSTGLLSAFKASGVAPLKSIQSTRLDFEDAVEQLLLQAIDGNVNKLTFVNRMMQLIRGYGFQAYRDGLKAGGVNDEMDDDDTAQAERLVQEQRQYVRGIADAIYEDDKVTEAEARGKPAMWFNKSVYPFYLLGIDSASANAALEWVLGRTEKHCVSCKALSGQVRRVKYWLSTVIPKSIQLACKGFRCDCKTVPTDKPVSRGKLPNWYPATA